MTRNTKAALLHSRNLKARVNPAQTLLSQHLKELNIHHTPEHKFHPSRKWRVDFYLPDLNTMLEIEGAVWVAGRHTRGSGFVKDMEKYNAIAQAGYRLLRFATEDVMRGRAKEFLSQYK